ncbi:MAG: ABC transporter permease [Clostridiales bacterium]|nr:ABC transporter permease [Clostridiales bacterium]
MNILIRSTLRLLFRNKAFWFFLLIAPALSILILNADTVYSINDSPSRRHEILEIGEDEKIAYYGGARSFSVKVYDASGSDMSTFLLQDLADTGMYSVLRASVPGMNESSLNDHISCDAMNDRMGAALFIAPDFDTLIKEGNTEEALRIFILSDDPRAELFENDIRLTLGELSVSKDTETLNGIREMMPQKEVESIAASGERNLSVEQENTKMKAGYAFSILTFGFVFCGVFVSHTAIEEQKNMVLTRIRLTGGRDLTYLLSKAVCAVIISVIITVILSAGLLIIRPDITGISFPKFILVVFLMGLIFSILSMFLGIISGEIMSSNFIAFTVWCMSSLFAGLYFPLDDSSMIIKAISFITPQRWFMEGVEMFLISDNRVFIYLLCITLSYLMVILSIGNVGIRLKKQEA